MIDRPSSPIRELTLAAYAVVTGIEGAPRWWRWITFMILGRRFMRDVVQLRRHLYLLWQMLDREV